VDGLSAREVFEHYILCRRCEAEERLSQLSAACQPWRDKGGQRAALEAAVAIGRVGTVRRTSFELADPETRIRMIGASAAIGGAEWERDHAAELRWLSGQRVSLAEARARNAAAVSAELRDPFWEPAAPPLRRKGKAKG
jgi:hypothetical protein